MSAPLSSTEEALYTRYIDEILHSVDLETVTRKKIRAELEDKLGGKDLSSQKAAIKNLIEARFDALTSSEPVDVKEEEEPAATASASPQPTPKRQANGYGDEDEDGDANGGEIEVSTQPPKKKQRKAEKSEDTEDSDAKLAAILQAQENQMSGRATRGGGSKAKPIKKKPRKKSSNKVRREDDSDVDGSEESTNKPRKAGGGFQKPFNLSAPLAEVCGGEARLPRPQVVKKLWEHIKANELQDPSDKRQILCDEKMYAIFKQAKVDMFQMNKLVGNHLYPVEEE
ncbi:Upstream activation factor subunit spp27 [Apiospora aurea]|uniref:Upstream activation factor subunit spp27 n=1 Tax=Apiospora aurea TaxID=335848 RepID=A0ABR1PS17_9PEZI